MTAPTDPVAVVDTCLICGRTADQHDMGTGLATCRGIAMPTFRSRARFEALIRADAYEQAAKVADLTSEPPEYGGRLARAKARQSRRIATAIRALSRGQGT